MLTLDGGDVGNALLSTSEASGRKGVETCAKISTEEGEVEGGKVGEGEEGEAKKRGEHTCF